MDTDLIRWRRDTPLRLAIALVGLHSCILGIAMLTATGAMLGLLGFAGAIPLFFPSQSGIFMLILGLFYLAAVVEPRYVWTIVVSKAFAVAFLVAHVSLLDAPPILWAAAAGDGAMLVAVLALLWRHERHTRLA